MQKPLIAVTGSTGQLGHALQHLAVSANISFDFLFTGRNELDLANPDSINVFFERHKPAYLVNCAAYTAVDKAETEQEAAYIINAESVGVLARQCRLNNCIFIGISTDYVFDGKGTAPYQPGDAVSPVNYYGYTKWLGEKLAQENNERTIIIRSSWVYSEQGNNFVRTMLRLMKEKPVINVVNDQVGCPTYATDLAEAILKVTAALKEGNIHYGIYQYSNRGAISWYDFAIAIRKLAGLTCEVLPVPTSAYPTPAKRPAYSVMDTSAITKDFEVEIKDWKKSLQTCITNLNR
jgi:dTDP-4-dehydrorhamnose reductase